MKKPKEKIHVPKRPEDISAEIRQLKKELKQLRANSTPISSVVELEEYIRQMSNLQHRIEGRRTLLRAMTGKLTRNELRDHVSLPAKINNQYR